MRLGADGLFLCWIEDHQIGVTADGDCSLARIQTEQLRRSSGNYLDEPICTELPRRHATGINQAHAVLNAGAAIWNLSEVAFADLFLFLEAERAMVG